MELLIPFLGTNQKWHENATREKIQLRYRAASRRRGPTVGVPAEGDDSKCPLSRCISLDLEVGVIDGRIPAFAGVHPDTGRSLTFPSERDGLYGALGKLEDFSKVGEFLLGHNLMEFDLSQLRALDPGLRLSRLPAVDTLRLNPLAVPRNSYHHLVKHYQG